MTLRLWQVIAIRHTSKASAISSRSTIVSLLVHLDNSLISLAGISHHNYVAMEGPSVKVESLLDVVSKNILVKAATLQLITKLIHVPVDFVILITNSSHIIT